MNTNKKIQKCLSAAPKPATPNGLLDRLKQDVHATPIEKAPSAIRRWFAPTGRSISLWRIAGAAAIALAAILPLCYGAVKVIRTFTAEVTFEYPEDKTMYRASSTIVAKGDTYINTLEDARNAIQEFRNLYREGKAEEVKPGVWVATLSNGEQFAYAGDPEKPSLLDMDTEEANEIFRERFEEIHELRKAGEFERTPLEDIERNGVIIRLYQDSFTLSDGNVVTLTSAVSDEEPPKNKDQD